ncbi:uncharacterized protein G2W53_012782 [Senna tora]|uniref:Uncharacterized protein n=1 Tax=Senna tora TaxID=362788 RepID=A0A834WSM5_9FABA|nr:uncharacterized protein G2W53_012782 [Senna tora]
MGIEVIKVKSDVRGSERKITRYGPKTPEKGAFES